MSHFSVAVFTKTVFEKPSDELKKLKEELELFKNIFPWKDYWDKEEQLYEKEFGKMDKEVMERTLKYLEYGVSDKTDVFLKENNYLEWKVDEDEEDGGYFTNPNSFWDWFKIGGRWGDIAKEIHYKKIKDIPIDSILEYFYGFVDLDNKYHSKGEMWWWGINDATDESSKEFDDKLIQYIKENPDLYILVVDYHV